MPQALAAQRFAQLAKLPSVSGGPAWLSGCAKALAADIEVPLPKAETLLNGIAAMYAEQPSAADRAARGAELRAMAKGISTQKPRNS